MAIAAIGMQRVISWDEKKYLIDKVMIAFHDYSI